MELLLSLLELWSFLGKGGQFPDRWVKLSYKVHVQIPSAAAAAGPQLTLKYDFVLKTWETNISTCSFTYFLNRSFT